MNGLGAVSSGLGMQGMHLHGLQGMNALGAEAPGTQANPPAAGLGREFGRDGMLAQGQGFSQRDAFEPARQGNPAQGNPAVEVVGSAEEQQTSALQRMVAAMVLAVRMLLEATHEEGEDMLAKMLREFQKWLHEMDAIFLQPSPG